MRLLLRWMVRWLRPRRMRRPPMTTHNPADLVFTDHEIGAHGRFRSASARGRHGTYYVIEEAFPS
ncbi:hypothetical protein [Streptomyces sp. NPDC001404]|uniref:hypothetical protein n=1 Tax=Streptomyces sp. NPDC001404 TaxID=3364571 RepID=UPI00368432B6